MAIFTVVFTPGANWIQGKGSREQPYWGGHAAHMDKLFSQGKIVLGGPYADYSKIQIIAEADNEAEIRAMFADDPWGHHGVTQAPEIHEWLIFLDKTQLKSKT